MRNVESFARWKSNARKCASLTCVSGDVRSNFESAASGMVGTPAVDAKVSTGDERENMWCNVEGVNGVRGSSLDRVRARFLVSH